MTAPPAVRRFRGIGRPGLRSRRLSSPASFRSSGPVTCHSSTTSRCSSLKPSARTMALRLASRGVLGTYGFYYGPAPTWVYQLLVATTRDLVVVSALHILLMSAVTAGALWWLSRSLGLWVWFATLPLLSPYYWFYARVLWDNPFLLPLGALALAGYAAHLESGSPLGLRVSFAALMTAPLVHLMSLSLVVPLGAHIADRPAPRAVGAQVQPRGGCSRVAAARLAVLDLPRQDRVRHCPAAAPPSTAGSFHCSGAGFSAPVGWTISTVPGRWRDACSGIVASVSSIGLRAWSGAASLSPSRWSSGLFDHGSVERRAHVAAISVGLAGVPGDPPWHQRRSSSTRTTTTAPGSHSCCWHGSPSMSLAAGRKGRAVGSDGGDGLSLQSLLVAVGDAGPGPAPQPGHAETVRADACQPATGRASPGQLRRQTADCESHVIMCHSVPAHAGDPARLNGTVALRPDLPTANHRTALLDPTIGVRRQSSWLVR